ncbi:metabotropic glutamate receptor 5-like [Patiria miniata]|uniref:G-protein coupled receptors family 3 profile domain-containing protein n=1 Tax=Patiria miniata TaxID=46514 RepID=A0A913YWS0_PATMI|nr:metabotropic glutamate receptor 5-like [Patiria miniata]
MIFDWRLGVFTLVFTTGLVLGAIPPDVRLSFARPGDFFIAGLFPFHYSGHAPCDSALSAWAVELSQTMVFAVESINRRPDLLPNVTLGFEIRDDCYSESMTLYTILSLLGSNGRLMDLDVPGDFRPGIRYENSTFLGAIGPVSSSNSILAGMTGSLFQMPVISYLATSDELSDKNRFPYFLRSTPPDMLNALAVIDILLRFGWDYVALIYSLDSYGIRGAQEVQKLAEKAGICLAFSSPISHAPSDAEIEEVVQKLKTYRSATVVVVFAASGAPYTILDEFHNQVPGSNLTFIGSAAFESVYRLKKISLSENTLGGIFVPLHYRDIDGFEQYFLSIGDDESDQPVSRWFQEFQMEWLAGRNCSRLSACPPATNNDEIFVMNAVNIFAHALHEVLTSVCHGNLTCTSEIVSAGERFLPYLLHVEFLGADGPFRFENNGEPAGRYTLKNVQMTTGGVIHTVQVGVWDSLKSEGRLSVDDDAVIWAGHTKVPPRSTCRELCQPGYIEVPLEQKCCWGCRQCPINAITENGDCVTCERTHWPNQDRTQCDPITPKAISWGSPPAVAVLVLSGTGVALSSLVAAGMYYYRSHPLIKATSRELSAIQIGGLFLAFATTVVTLARPSEVACHCMVTMISLCYTVMFSATLLKVNRIFRIFKASKKSTKRPSWTSPRTQVTIASILIFIQFDLPNQVLISIISIALNSTKPELLFQVPAQNHIELYCLFGYEAIASLLYNLVLVLVCCFYALRARKVPSNYNESKFIAANVYSTLVFSVAALPVYATATTTSQRVVTLCVVVLLNAYGTIFMAFLPKLYAVRFVGDIEVTREGTGASTRGTSLSTSRSIRVHPSELSIDTTGTASKLPSVAGSSNVK